MRLKSSCLYMLRKLNFKDQTFISKIDRGCHRVLILGFYKGKSAQNEPKERYYVLSPTLPKYNGFYTCIMSIPLSAGFGANFGIFRLIVGWFPLLKSQNQIPMAPSVNFGDKTWFLVFGFLTSGRYFPILTVWVMSTTNVQWFQTIQFCPLVEKTVSVHVPEGFAATVELRNLFSSHCCMTPDCKSLSELPDSRKKYLWSG